MARAVIERADRQVERPLPELRADLQVVHAAEASGYVLLDPLKDRYYRIDDLTARLLSLWPRSAGYKDLLRRAHDAGLAIGEDELSQIAAFLLANELACPREAHAWQRLAAAERRQRGSWIGWLAKNYLFVKFPLFRPQAWLGRWSPNVAVLQTRAAAVAVAALGLAGLHLVSRQWDAFVSTFTDFLSIEGVLTFAFATALVKSLHELGHAFTAVRFGCRVPTMGLCLMMAVPMLYADVSDAWRLPSRRQRVLIHAAGLIVEIAVAAVALFLWSFLPEGQLKGLAFALATVSIVMSLALNLNPFMRFDGYYLLVDATGVENLQPRAFEIGLWRMRELLFDLGRPPPEPMSRRYLTILTVYAWATWLYRLILFVGIAIVVYGIGFKLLGLALFLVEIIFLLGRPIMAEVKTWISLREEILTRRRGLWVGSAIAVFAISCLVPWSTTIRVPALLDDRAAIALHARRPAVVHVVHAEEGQRLARGDAVVSLASFELDHEIERAERQLSTAMMRHQRRVGSAEDRSNTHALEKSIDGLTERIAGLKAERSDLDIRMPVAGTIAEIGEALREGRWIKRGEAIALVIGGDGCRVRSYVSEDDVARLDLSAPARFVAEDPLMWSWPVRLNALAIAASDTVELPELTTHYGGSVYARMASNRPDGRAMVPVVGQYLVSGDVDTTDGCRSERALRGTLHLSGKAESVAARLWRRVLNVLVRESGF